MMSLHRLSFLCLFLIPHALTAQTAYVDSLRNRYQSEADPQARIDILYQIALEESLDNPGKGMAYADTLANLAEEEKYSKGLAMSYHLRGFAFDDQGKHQEALEAFKLELSLFQELGDTDEISTCYTNLGSIFSNLGQMDSSIFYYVRALEMDEQSGDLLGASIVHNNIGQIYSDEGVYEKAIEHFEEALKIRQNLGEEKRLMACYSNLATVYGRMEQYEKAEGYSKLAMDYAVKFDNLAYAGVIANNAGSNYNDQEHYSKAIPWLEKALQYWQELGNEAYATYAYYNLSKAYAGLGNGNQALAYANQGWEIVQRLQLENQHELYYKAFAAAYEVQGDLRSAFDWYRKFVFLADSNFKLENTRKVAEMESRYEVQKKEAELARQELELTRQTSQKRTILFGSLAVILLLIGFFQYVRNQQKIKNQQVEYAASLRQAEADKLRELDAVKSTFFANTSHEFRTPLTLIISPLEQMIAGNFKGDLQKYYRILLRNSRRLLDLVNQLLDLSKLESGKLKLKPAKGDLGKLIRTVAGSFESLAVRKQIKFEVHVPVEPLDGIFDHDVVEKILVNLISNAFKFTAEEGLVQVHVARVLPDSQAVSVDNPPDRVTIEVQDSGIGIPSDQIDDLFDRFTRSTYSEIQAGSGIGLALTRELTEIHGGSLTVDSVEGVGSTFRVILQTGGFKEYQNEGPLPKALTQEERSEPAESSSLETRSVGSSPLAKLEHQKLPIALIAEDHQDVRDFVTEILDDQFRVVATNNGKAAWEQALTLMPDLIVTDVMMPEMDGIRLCQLLKSNEKTSHIPVVMLTARAAQEDKLEGLESGADVYLIKPFSARELLIQTKNLIEQRKKLQEFFRKKFHALTPAEMESDSIDAVFLDRVRKAIEENYDDEQFSVIELSQAAGMSRSQLHRKLTALTGYSPSEIIRQMRLERARQMLEHKTGNVSEIAFRCGFSSPAYFSKCFKDHFGVSPGSLP